MAHSNPSLLPTVITDKNGKVTTVHKKQAAATASPVGVPAPALGGKAKPKTTLASRVKDVAQAFSQGSERQVIKTKVERWIKFSTPEQLVVLDEVLESFDSMSEHEKFVVIAALEPLTYRTGHTNAIHEVLAMRSAFCSDWAVANNPRHTSAVEGYVVGMRTDNYRTPLDLTDNEAVRENKALIRFAYELTTRSPYGGFLPVYQAQTQVGADSYVYEYDREELKDLIRENADRVDVMVELALDNETCDPQRLQALMEHEGHSSLTGGAL